ncbi:aminopeptidase P family protein [Coprothermobacter platensis]|uniref:aminopeptidase P family protein n=1 Tax=Coprothermobacter platensis TaxID=108819 RepID=UPI0003726929|nr:aminopeptidase P family protein [Coprothermobacter platensis]
MDIEKLLSGADALFICDRPTLRWLTGFTGDEGYAFFSNDVRLLLVDSRFTQQALLETKGVDVIEYKQPLFDFLSQRGLLKGTIAVNGSSISYNMASKLVERGVALKDVGEEILFGRAVKTSQEIEYIEKSIDIAEQAFLKSLPVIKAGATEKEFAAELEYQSKKLGAEGMSFDTIVGSGWRGALPHGVASDKKFEDGELVVIDWGCLFNGYCSDLTRTVAIGNVDKEAMDVVNVVLEAHERAASATEFSTGADLDAIGRSVIESHGYGENFGHSLGHGIGLEIHEYPSISQRVQHKLVDGHVFTIEPGIYLPGKFGVRIEDDYVLEGGKIKRLSHLDQIIMV